MTYGMSIPRSQLSSTSADGDKMQAVEKWALQQPQVKIPLTNLFAPGVYWREISIPADTFVLGHKHKTKHFNVVLSGRCLVSMNGVVEEVIAPAVIISEAGVRKAVFVVEEMRWATVHPTDETNIESLEEMFVEKSTTFLEFHNDLEALEVKVKELKP